MQFFFFSCIYSNLLHADYEPFVKWPVQKQTLIEFWERETMVTLLKAKITLRRYNWMQAIPKPRH